MSRKDIITWVIERMMAHDDSITQDLALTVEREARAEWGGQRIEYIAKTIPADERAKVDARRRSVEVDLLTTEQPTNAIARRHGLSRAALYRLVKRSESSE